MKGLTAMTGLPPLGLLSRFGRLGRLGVLGLNARNLDLISPHNPRKLYPLVDDKILTKALVSEAGLQVPQQYCVVAHQGGFKRMRQALQEREGFVIKPARGSQGGGILVAGSANSKGIRKPNGRLLDWGQVRFHVSNILAGMYSMGGGADRALVEERLDPHPAFDRLAFGGVPDVRVIVFRGVPAMAMVRLPTSLSDGAANLHQGGVGAGVDLTTGRTTRAVLWGRPVLRHPDHDTPLEGFTIPRWDDLLELAARLGSTVGLGYLGVDLVIDEVKGPTLLELNARPGISIQIANGRGLRPALERIAALDDVPTDAGQRVTLAREIALTRPGRA